LRFGLALGIVFAITAEPWIADVPAVANGRDEAATVTALVRRGLAEAPKNFSAIRGKSIGLKRYATTAGFGKFLPCVIEDHSPTQKSVVKTDWQLVCRSIEHKISVAELAGWLQPAVGKSIPFSWNFGIDNDSIGDYKLGWQRSYHYPLAVWAFVTEDKQGSYYVLTVDHLIDR
jgi:hypothetical protein